MLSIIIHVHNNAEALVNCLNSIMAQGGGFEVILINNGSTDESAALCDKYRERDGRVQVIHMEESPAAAALNAGIKLAGGEYIHFTSPDGYMEEGAFEKVQPLLGKGTDIIFIETSVSKPKGHFDISTNNILRRLCQELPQGLWDKLISRELLIREDISFAEGDIWVELDFCITLHLHAKTYSATDFLFYHHTNEQELDFSKIMLTLSKWTGPAEAAYEDYQQIIHRWMAAMYSDLLLPNYSKLPAEYANSMSDFLWLLDVRKARRDKVAKALQAVLGLRIASYIMANYREPNLHRLRVEFWRGVNNAKSSYHRMRQNRK